MPEEIDETPVDESGTDESAQATEQEVAPEQPKAKLKVGANEYEESTLEELIRKAGESEDARKKADQIRREGYRKFEEAAGLRKQFEKIQSLVHQNPEAGLIELATIMGLPPEALEKLWAQKADLNKRWEQWTPEQRELYLTQQKVKQLETERSENQRQAEEKEASGKATLQQQAFEKELAKDTFPAMQEAGLPQTGLTLKLVAATLGALADRDGPDQKPDIREAVAYVSESFHNTVDEKVKGFAKDPKAFAARYPEVADALRKMSVAEARGKAPGQADAPSGKQPTARPNGSSQEKPANWSDMTKFFRNLQRGGRP